MTSRKTFGVNSESASDGSDTGNSGEVYLMLGLAEAAADLESGNDDPPTIAQIQTFFDIADMENGRPAIIIRTDNSGRKEFEIIGDLNVRGNSNVGAANLEDLGDVVITSPADNELLAYDNVSGDWINQTLAEVGITPVTLDSAFNNGKEIDGANSLANAMLVGDGTDKVAIYTSGGKAILGCVDHTHTVILAPSNTVPSNGHTAGVNNVWWRGGADIEFGSNSKTTGTVCRVSFQIPDTYKEGEDVIFHFQIALDGAGTHSWAVQFWWAEHDVTNGTIIETDSGSVAGGGARFKWITTTVTGTNIVKGAVVFASIKCEHSGAGRTFLYCVALEVPVERFD